jgi:hypothetical protein
VHRCGTDTEQACAGTLQLGPHHGAGDFTELGLADIFFGRTLDVMHREKNCLVSIITAAQSRASLFQLSMPALAQQAVLLEELIGEVAGTAQPADAFGIHWAILQLKEPTLAYTRSEELDEGMAAAVTSSIRLRQRKSKVALDACPW